MELTQNTSSPVIYAVQDDRYSRQLELTLLAGGTPWIIPEDAGVLIRYLKSDGKGGQYNTLPDENTAWTAEENVLTLTLAPQVLTCPGVVNLAVTLMQGQMQISTFAIIICVEASVGTASKESEEYFHVPGFLPAPRDAAEGQFLQVSAVDAAGHVTALKAASIEGNAAVTVEPAEEDIPKVFFGAALPQTKDDAVMSFRYISKTEDISGYCKTKAQGNSSMAYPKKNQTVKLYKDAACTEKLKVDFKGWGKQNKFCFKANWIDLTHARNIVSARLWGDVVKSRTNYDNIPELLRTSPNQGTIDGFPVKVYANGIYQGRYTINIPKDAWMANMDDKLDEHCILCGENYVSGCFRAEAKIDESDWTDEVHNTVPDRIKARWNQAIRFVMNSTDEEFVSGIGNFFDVDSLIDYYLFGLTSCGLDAFGKNQLYMTYDGQKWFATMYDMDSTWGLWWDGYSFVSSAYSRNKFQDFKDGNGNLLYIRLEKLFAEAIRERWKELKNGVLTIENIINRFERFADIASSELVKEDYASTTAGGAFTGIPSQSTSNIQQIRAYVKERLAWVNDYLNGEAEEESDILYEMAAPTVFDGSTIYVDTGVQLFDTAKDFTVFVDFDGVTPSAGAYGYLLDTSIHENTDNSNLMFGYEEGNSYPKLRASGKNNHAWEDYDNDNWGNTWNNLQRIILVYVGGVFSFGKYLKKNDTANPQYIHASDGVAYSHSEETLKIGARKNYWTGNMCDFWTGTVNACRVYNRAMTETEAEELMEFSM